MTDQARKIGARTSGALLLLALGCLVALHPDSAQAGPDDSVAILPTGGTRVAHTYTIEPAGDGWESNELGTRRFLNASEEAVAISDFKILSRGRHLLGGVRERGALITDSEGAVSFTLHSPGTQAAVPSASVAGYTSDGAVRRLVVPELNQNRISIYERGISEPLWSHVYARPSARAHFVQAVALPEQRLAVATNWEALGLSAVDLYDLASEETPVRPVMRVANIEHEGAPSNLFLVEEMQEIRDLFGMSNGNLLVATRFHLFSLSTEGDVIWSLDIADQESISGEFTAARELPSGRLAVATAQPGTWTRPHDNHRVHWLDAASRDSVARTPPLEFAPRRVEPADGHGGSGAFDFYPGMDFVPTATLDDLELVGPLTFAPDTVRRGRTVSFEAQLGNLTDRAATVRRAMVHLAPAPETGCAELEPNAELVDAPDTRTISEKTHLSLAGRDSVRLSGSTTADERFEAERWCGFVALEDGSDSHFPGAPASLRIVPADGDASGGGIDPLDLGLRKPDAGPYGDIPGTPPDRPSTETGCGCTTSSNGNPAVPITLTLFALWFLRRSP